MRFRLGYASGFATGYYLGAKAGRQRYDQINRSIRKIKRSDTYETVTEKAKTVLDEGVEKAKELVDRRSEDGSPGESSTATGTTAGATATAAPPTTADGSANGTNTIPAAAPLTGQSSVAPPPKPTTTPKPNPPYSSSK